MTEGRPIWTIGHSNHPIGRFLTLLDRSGVQVVADVRSQPFSRFNPQFNRRPLSAALRAWGIEYVFLGRELGGRPPERDFYDHEGHVVYGEIAATARFGDGLHRLLEEAEKVRVAVMCSEENPTTCHRRLLVARVLEEGGTTVTHIRGDGTVILDDELAKKLIPSSQGDLFGGEEGSWRSVRRVGTEAPPRPHRRPADL